MCFALLTDWTAYDGGRGGGGAFSWGLEGYVKLVLKSWINKKGAEINKFILYDSDSQFCWYSRVNW